MMYLFSADIKHKTVSLWSMVNSSQEQYKNPMFRANPTGPQIVLKPNASMRNIRLWKGLYCRWNPSMRPQDNIYQRTRELLALQEQLQKQVTECKLKISSRPTPSNTRLASPLH